MSQLRINRINRKVKRHLDKERYEHTLGVMYTAGALAMRYGSDLEQALIAGLLHDCAKCISDEKRLKLCEQYHLDVSRAEQENPSLLHAKVGALLTVQKYRIHDKDIVDAIACHTTGKPEMSLLDKIIYIADYIEPGRFKSPNLDKVRELAFQDIEECLYIILESSLNHIRSKGSVIDPMTETAYLYYKNIRNKSQQ